MGRAYVNPSNPLQNIGIDNAVEYMNINEKDTKPNSLFLEHFFKFSSSNKTNQAMNIRNKYTEIHNTKKDHVIGMI